MAWAWATERRGLLPRRLQVLLDGGALLRQAGRQVAQAALGLGVDERLRRLLLHQLHERVDGPVAERHRPLDSLHRAQPGAQVGPQLLDGLELAGLVGPLVVDLGEHLLLHVLHEHPEVDGHLGVLRIVGVELEDVADLGAGEAGVQLRHDRAAADGVEVVVGGQTGDRLVVDRAGDVDAHLVATLGGAVDRGQLAHVRAQPLDLGVDLLVGDLGAGDRDTEAPVPGHVDLRAHLHHRVEGDGAVLLAGGDVDLRRRDHVDLGLRDGPGVVARHRLAEGLLAGHARAQASLQDPTGGLARAEPGDADLPGDAAEGGVDVALELGLVELHGDLHEVALERLDGRLHRRRSVPGAGGGPRR
jgi:hypothetical protein